MKTLVNRTVVSQVAPFVLTDLKDFLSVDFTDDDALITNIGFAAASEIEQFAQIALLTQTIRLAIFDPNMCDANLLLPIGPVDDAALPTVTIDGVAFSDFTFLGGNRALIRWGDSFFDLTPDRITIQYLAGFGAAAADIPADLSQAIMDQAALHYDGRSPMNARELTTSPHMARVGARYRGVQV